MIFALCITAIEARETWRIKLYSLFIVCPLVAERSQLMRVALEHDVFVSFDSKWMFIVPSVIWKDVVELCVAIITFFMFPLVAILAFLVNEYLRRASGTCPFIVSLLAAAFPD